MIFDRISDLICLEWHFLILPLYDLDLNLTIQPNAISGRKCLRFFIYRLKSRSPVWNSEGKRQIP